MTTPGLTARIAIGCTATALPVVAEYRQPALAASLVAMQRVLADLGDLAPSARNAPGPFDHARRAVASAPHPARWAEEFTVGHNFTRRAFQRRSAPAIARVVVVDIAAAVIPDSDSLLYELLATVTSDCIQWLGSDSTGDQPGSTDRGVRAPTKTSS